MLRNTGLDTSFRKMFEILSFPSGQNSQNRASSYLRNLIYRLVNRVTCVWFYDNSISNMTILTKPKPGETLVGSFARGLAEELLPLEDRPGYALDGADLPWRHWCGRYFPSLTAFAKRHEDTWDWFDRLITGLKPRPYILIWGRGGAKSSTLEMGIVRLCSRLTRRFVLYVCETQSQADAHVQSIEALLSLIGAQPSMNLAGRTRAWRRNQLRTKNGFNVAAFGLDVASRGIKIDQYRPDVIVFDDIDGLHDSPEAIEKKIECITRTILPTGSSDCAVILGQNLITANSIASQLADDRAKFLLDREVPPICVAVEGLEVEVIPQGPGLPARYKIIGGEATWPGQDLATCEKQINEWGLDTFKREAQHEVKQGGDLAFPTFQGINHVALGVHGRHIIEPMDIPAHWTPLCGKDKGWNAPFAFLLAYIDDAGGIVVTQEIVERHKTPSQQVKLEKSLLQENGAMHAVIYSDTDMWAKALTSDGVGEAPVEECWRAGLKYVQANKNREHGWDNLRKYLEGEQTLRIVGENCPVLCKQIGAAIHDKKKTEDVDDDADKPPSHMDALQALRYLLMSRPRASVAPTETKTPEEIAVDVAAAMARERVKAYTDAPGVRYYGT